MTSYGTVDGFRAAAAEAHRRRTRAIGAAAGAVAVALVFAGSLQAIPRADGDVGLDIATTPTPRVGYPTGAPATPAPQAAEPDALGNAAAPGTAVTSPATPAAVRPVAATGPQSEPLARVDAGRSDCPNGYLEECTSVRDVRPAERKYGDFRYVVRGTYCPTVPAGPYYRYSFPTVTEADFTAERDGQVLWSSAADYPAGAGGAHEYSLRFDTCVHWVTRWTGRTNAGVPLHGTFTLRLRTLAAGAHPQIYPNTITLP